LNLSYKECAQILYDSIKLIQNGTVKRIPQNTISEYGMYCGMRKEGDEKLSWHQSSRDIFNIVRALTYPGPMSVTLYNQKPVYINKVIYNENYCKYKGIPGQILGYDSGMPIVKTLDSVILLSDYKSEYKLKIGDRLI
jgi:methionyl-tRNA formyltransferase